MERQKSNLDIEEAKQFPVKEVAPKVKIAQVSIKKEKANRLGKVMKALAWFIPKLALQVILVVAFFYYFGVPSLLRFLEAKVLVVASEEETAGVAAPSITLCGRSPALGPWREAGGLEGALKRCRGTSNLFTCMEGMALRREEVVVGVSEGGNLTSSKVAVGVWTSHLLRGYWSCHTFTMNRTVTPSDEVFFHINRSLLYAHYIHSPEYFIQNYNPLALPSNYGKLFPSLDCNSYFSLSLTSVHQLSTLGTHRCQEGTYSFVGCLEEAAASRVGCSLRGNNTCTSEQQYRLLSLPGLTACFRFYHNLYKDLFNAENSGAIARLSDCLAPCEYSRLAISRN